MSSIHTIQTSSNIIVSFPAMSSCKYETQEVNTGEDVNAESKSTCYPCFCFPLALALPGLIDCHLCHDFIKLAACEACRSVLADQTTVIFGCCSCRLAVCRAETCRV